MSLQRRRRPPLRRCPGCRRLIPIVRKKWARHYEQGRGWTGPDGGPRTLCEYAEERYEESLNEQTTPDPRIGIDSTR